MKGRITHFTLWPSVASIVFVLLACSSNAGARDCGCTSGCSDGGLRCLDRHGNVYARPRYLRFWNVAQ